MTSERSEGEELFERLKLLKFPSLAPVRLKPNSSGVTSGDTTRSLAGQFETELEALLTSKPYEEPMESTEGLHIIQEELALAIVEAFNKLTEEEQWIYHMLVDVGLSMRFVAYVLDIPKTTFARRRDELAEKIRKLLLEHGHSSAASIVDSARSSGTSTV